MRGLARSVDVRVQVSLRHEGGSECLEDECEECSETSEVGSETCAEGQKGDEQRNDGEEESDQEESKHGPGKVEVQGGAAIVSIYP